MPLKTEHGASDSSLDEHSKAAHSSKVVVLADLNVDPPEMDDDSSVHVSASTISRLSVDESNQDKTVAICKDTNTMEVEGRHVSKIGKCRSRNNKVEYSLDSAADADGDQHGQGVSTSREEKVSSLKTGLVHVARKMPKNAHAHFILGLMYQRLGQPQKAVSAYEKAEEILLQSDVEIHRPELLSLVQTHHAQCLLLESAGDNSSDKELDQEELDEILSKLKHSIQSDVRQAAMWNTLGLILLSTGRVKSALSVLSSLLAIVPNNYDCLGNLGIAYLQSGNMELSEKCFQELILKDQNHPAALINYAAFLLCKYGSTVVGAGANAGDGGVDEKVVGMNVAKECLLATLKVDPKAAHAWANLANVYFVTGDHRSSAKCLEKVAKLEPNCMAMRYSVAMHRLKDAERSQDRSEQLSWAGNEMASIIRDGDGLTIDHPVAWAGLSMVHKAQHEIASGFRTDQSELRDVEEHAVYSLYQGIAEDPDDAVQWHQFGLHSLCTREFKTSQRYLKAAIARFKNCSYAWSNLGISLQLSDNPTQAEEVYKKALSLVATEQAHSVFCNLGNLYRQQKQYERAKAMFSKSLELQPGYAPAFNNLGLVFIAEGRWEEAKYCFEKALEADPLLDSAKSNLIKTVAVSRLCNSLSSCRVKD
ncbi:putative UDP-N-acetylglucosamine--peptide N-acetylglucosaminyltransferase SPINDLY [Cucurbita argyrosperma subsp. argyrosperma]